MSSTYVVLSLDNRQSTTSEQKKDSESVLAISATRCAASDSHVELIKEEKGYLIVNESYSHQIKSHSFQTTV